MSKSMFTDEEFEKIRPLLNQSMAHRDPRVEIVKLDVDIERLLAEYSNLKEKSEKTEAEYKAAISILLQGRNLVARYVGDEERAMPELSQPSTNSPLLEKYVAVVMPDIENDLQAAAIRELLSWSQYEPEEQARIRYIYNKAGNGSRASLIEDILGGKVCGVIAFQTKGQGSIAGSIRHDLKSRPNWDFEKAEAYVLPPCVDIATLDDPIYKDCGVLVAGEIIRQMLKGEYRPQTDSEEFSLEKALPSLVARMCTPKEEMMVVVIDDSSLAVNGIKTVLKAWPKIETRVVMVGIHEDITIVSLIPGHAHIILLDEALQPGLTGTDVARRLRQNASFQHTVIASTTTGSKPDWARYHFSLKKNIETRENAAREFVSFMNELIRIVEECS